MIAGYMDEEQQNEFVGRFTFGKQQTNKAEDAVIKGISSSIMAVRNDFERVRTFTENIAKLQQASTISSKRTGREAAIEGKSNDISSIESTTYDIASVLAPLTKAFKELSTNVDRIPTSSGGGGMDIASVAAGGLAGGLLGKGIGKIAKIGGIAAAVGAVGYVGYNMLSEDEPEGAEKPSRKPPTPPATQAPQPKQVARTVRRGYKDEQAAIKIAEPKQTSAPPIATQQGKMWSDAITESIGKFVLSLPVVLGAVPSVIEGAKNVGSWISEQWEDFTEGFESSDAPTGSRAEYMKAAYDTYIRMGLTHEGAATMVAQINRENNFRTKDLFGTHIDAANGKINVGMFSWQGDRGRNILEFMKSRGLVRQNKIVPGVESVGAMAEFSIMEMKKKYNKSYAAVTNPKLEYKQIESIVGDNYVGWRRTDPEYSKSGYANQNRGYAEINALVGGNADSFSYQAGNFTGNVLENAYQSLMGGDALKNAGKYLKLASSAVNIAGLHPTVLARLGAMGAEYYTRTGKKIQVNSGLRTYAQQAELYRKDPSKAARPGRSRHQSGLAVDIQSVQANDLARLGLLQKYGFIRPVRGEAWHLEPKEGVNLPRLSRGEESQSKADTKAASLKGQGQRTDVGSMTEAYRLEKQRREQTKGRRAPALLPSEASARIFPIGGAKPKPRSGGGSSSPQQYAAGLGVG